MFPFQNAVLDILARKLRDLLVSVIYIIYLTYFIFWRRFFIWVSVIVHNMNHDFTINLKFICLKNLIQCFRLHINFLFLHDLVYIIFFVNRTVFRYFLHCNRSIFIYYYTWNHFFHEMYNSMVHSSYCIFALHILF